MTGFSPISQKPKNTRYKEVCPWKFILCNTAWHWRKTEDPERPLSSTGEQQIRASAKAIRKMGLKFDLIITSTKKRSRQTAEIVAKTIGYPTESIIETDSVRPSALPQTTIDFIGQFKDKNSIFIAGHLPSLPKLASYLLSEGSEISIHFENGGLCCIAVEILSAGSGDLRYYTTPQQLQLIAG